jgi:hypothetical protein
MYWSFSAIIQNNGALAASFGGIALMLHTLITMMWIL